MPEYLSPGVYVEERDTGTKPIEGVSTSTAGFVGMTRRGRTPGLPQLVTSFPDFERKFGGYLDLGPTFANHQYLPHAVEGFFVNGGKRLYISRVVPASADEAFVVAKGGAVTRLATDTSLTTPDRIRVLDLAAIDDNAKVRLRQTKHGVVTQTAEIDVDSYDRNTGEVELASSLTDVFEAAYTAVEVTSLARANSFTLRATSAGSWGNEIDLRPSHSSAARADVKARLSTTQVELLTTAGFYVGAWVEFDTGKRKHLRRVTAIDGPVLTLTGGSISATLLDPANPPEPTVARTREFDLSISFGGVSERLAGLTLENVPGRYFVDRIAAESQLLLVDTAAAMPPNTSPELFPSADDGLRIVLGAGTDGTAAPTDDDYRGTDNGPGQRSGIQALIDIDGVSIVAVPGRDTIAVQNALIAHCELLMDRFAILDPGNSAQTLDQIQAQRGRYDTKYAALYFPRIVARDPVSGTDVPLPPSGHMAGIYARTDVERGVHKAPANEVVRGIVDLEQSLTKGEQDVLNPAPMNVNVLRDFRETARGLRVWGARCITSDGSWKYVNVRRLFIFLEESLDEGTQWVVFEPNDEALWARVTQSVSNFLTRVWRDGALMGTTPEEAFFVRCDRTTMTQDDIDNGRLIMVIGVAPVKPAEFVVIRIGQWDGGSAVEEI